MKCLPHCLAMAYLQALRQHFAVTRGMGALYAFLKARGIITEQQAQEHIELQLFAVINTMRAGFAGA